MNEDNEQTRIQRANARRRYIVERLKEEDAVRITDLAERFNCSPHTVRNDLRFLREIGLEVHTKRGILSANASHKVSIVREIKFPPGYKDAGVSILSYFSRVLEEKYPDTDATVIISQHGDFITLKVESDEGELERIEETLADYGKVIKGEITPKVFLPNAIASIELSNKLEMAKMELRFKEQSFIALADSQNGRIISLESQVTELRTLIGTQLSTVQDLARSLSTIAKSNRVSVSVAKAIETISRLAEAEHTKKNEKELTKALMAVKKENGSIFDTIKGSILSFTNSVAANIATPWVVTVLNSLPK